MTPCKRGPVPALLASMGAALARRFAEARHADRPTRFDWPPALREAVRAALAEMTDDHCSYCDGSNLGATARPEIDHFRPKSRPEFCALVCEWSNLYLACTACNAAKHEQWDEDLLPPDAPEYAFEQYFEYDFGEHRLLPNPASSPSDQRRAEKTIQILELNRADACDMRRRAIRYFKGLTPEQLRGEPYRFLVPLVT